MAALFRLNQLQCLRSGLKALTLKQNPCRTMSTLPKQGDTTEDPSKNKMWVSYGFNHQSESRDRHYLHMTFFVTVTLCLVGGAAAIAYAPDPAYHDWAQREAYLQIRYREERGLPPIDPNVVDPAKVVLPTDEELGDTEIII